MGRASKQRAPAKQREWRRGDPINYNNEALRQYYRDQRICGDEAELAAMFEAYRSELPASFRLTASFELPVTTKKFYDEVDLGDDKPAQVDWCPVAYAMQHLDRRELRKSEKWRAFKQRLVADFERGALQRQELVSMIPVSCMLNFATMPTDGSLPDIRVLDMCAAPGSKTSQALDYITRCCAVGSDFPQIPSKCAVIGNELDITRARLLSHQIQKVENPYYATICSEASNLPKAQSENTLYTNIICDVPCSGDGTLRKNFGVWTSWNPSSGMAMHSRQVKILHKGLELLAPGGVLVYSTCSMNPLENEAVVAAGLMHDSNCHLVPLSDCLPQLNAAFYKPGLTEWKVPAVMSFRPYMPAKPESKPAASAEAADTESAVNTAAAAANDATDQPMDTVDPAPADSSIPDAKKPRLEPPKYFETFEEARAEQERPVIHETMFAGHYSDAVRGELVKTARFAPHLLNSGGFFVAVFQRPADSPMPSLKSNKKTTESLFQYGQDTVRVEVLRAEALNEIAEFYGLGSYDYSATADDKGLVAGTERRASSKTCVAPIAPYEMEELGTKLFQKTDSEKKVLLGTPQLYNLYRDAATLNFISFGACVFEQLDRKFVQSSNCAFRVTGAGAVWLSGYMRRRRVELPAALMLRFLENDGLTRPELLAAEAAGELSLAGCRRRAANGAELLETGGAVASCCGAGGVLVTAALITVGGHFQPMLRTAQRQTLTTMLTQ